MSVEALSWVFKNSPYEGRERLVHLAIADVVNDTYEHRVFLGDQGIAAKARCSVRTVVRAKAKMVSEGFLELLERSSPGKTAEYRFLMPETHAKMAHDANARQNARQRTPKRASCPITNSRGTQETRDELLLQAFSVCWEHYPRKINRKAAARAFTATVRRCGDEVIHDLKWAVHHYAASCQLEHSEPRFIKHGSTFFGPDEPWRDWVAGIPEPVPLRPSEGRRDASAANLVKLSILKDLREAQ